LADVVRAATRGLWRKQRWSKFNTSGHIAGDRAHGRNAGADAVYCSASLKRITKHTEYQNKNEQRETKQK
jgi:hypothetical protein